MDLADNSIGILIPRPVGMQASATWLGSSDTPLTPELEEVLKKSGIVPEKWMLLLEGLEHRFSRAAGGLESLDPILVRLGQHTVRGIQLIRNAFS